MDDNELGQQAFQQKQFDDAIIHFTNAAERPNNHPSVRSNGFTNRGYVLKMLGKTDEALNDFNLAIQMNAQNDAPYINRGLLLHDQYKKYDDALKDYNYAISINPHNFSAYNNRGRIYTHHFKYYDLALQDFNRAIELNPKSAQTYAQRGFLLVTRFADQYPKLLQALKDMETSISLDPNSGANYAWKSLVLMKLGRLDSATEFANTAISMNVKTGIPYYVKAQILAKENKPPTQEIIQNYREFVSRGCPVKEYLNEGKTTLKKIDPEYEKIFNNPAKMKLSDALRTSSQWREICLLLNNAGEGLTWRDLGDKFHVSHLELEDMNRISTNPAELLLKYLDSKFSLEAVLTELEDVNWEAANKINEFMRGSNNNN